MYGHQHNWKSENTEWQMELNECIYLTTEVIIYHLEEH